MPTSTASGAKIRGEAPGHNAYNSLAVSKNKIANDFLDIVDGQKTNVNENEVSNYLINKRLSSRDIALSAASLAVEQAKAITSMSKSAFDEIITQLADIKNNVKQAVSNEISPEEKVFLAKSAYQTAKQIQSITDTTIFAEQKILKGEYTGDWTVGYYTNENLIDVDINLSKQNVEYGLSGNASMDFNLNATAESPSIDRSKSENFAGVEGLNLKELDEVSSQRLGVFADSRIKTTLMSIAEAITNLHRVNTYVGGVELQLSKKENLIETQVTNFQSNASKIQDRDVAKDQMKIVLTDFLDKTALTSLSQANYAPKTFLKLFYNA